MAAVLPILTAVSAIAGTASAIQSIRKSKKSGEALVGARQKLPEKPTEEDAVKTAEEQAKKRRRQIQRTDLTRGQALVPDLNVEKKSLLGA